MPTEWEARTHSAVDVADTPEDECPITTLRKAECAHCRHADMRPRFRQPPLFDTPELPPDVAHTFTAKWPGRCSECDRTFQPGALVGKLDDGDYLCGSCM